MTTGVVRGEISMTPLESVGPKIGVGANSVQLSFMVWSNRLVCSRAQGKKEKNGCLMANFAHAQPRPL